MYADPQIPTGIHREFNLGAFAGATRIFQTHRLTAATAIAVRRRAAKQRHAHTAIAAAIVFAAAAAFATATLPARRMERQHSITHSPHSLPSN